MSCGGTIRIIVVTKHIKYFLSISHQLSLIMLDCQLIKEEPSVRLLSETLGQAGSLNLMRDSNNEGPLRLRNTIYKMKERELKISYFQLKSKLWQHVAIPLPIEGIFQVIN